MFDIERSPSVMGLGPSEQRGDGGGRTCGRWTGSSYIVTAVMAGVLSLGRAMAQLGLVFGPAVALLFSAVTCYTSALLTGCYRPAAQAPADDGKRRYTYMDAITDNLAGGTTKAKICGFLQYANMAAAAVGYTAAASEAMMAMTKSSSHVEGQLHGDLCNGNDTASPPARYKVFFGAAQVVLSLLIPGFEQAYWLSMAAAATSLAYASVGVGLGIAQATKGRCFKFWGSLIPPQADVWRGLWALGAVAFPYSYSHMLLDVRDTMSSSEAADVGAAMRSVNVFSVAVTALFYTLTGVVGYAGFGAAAPENLLAGFREPAWLLDAAEVAVLIHLAGAYQVCCQLLFASVEGWARRRWPQSSRNNYWLRLAWRAAFVVAATVAPILLPTPFVNDVVALLSAIAFWPLTVYFPVEMYIAREQVQKWSTRWVMLRILSFVCLVASVAASVGCLARIVSKLR